MFFEDNIDDAKYCGHLYGLGTSYVQNGSSYENHAYSHGAQQNAHSTTNNVETPVSTSSTTSWQEANWTQQHSGVQGSSWMGGPHTDSRDTQAGRDVVPSWAPEW